MKTRYMAAGLAVALALTTGCAGLRKSKEPTPGRASYSAGNSVGPSVMLTQPENPSTPSTFEIERTVESLFPPTPIQLEFERLVAQPKAAPTRKEAPNKA